MPAGTQGDVPPRIRHPIYAEVYPVASSIEVFDWRALIEGDFKYLWSSGGARELYDLDSDAEEAIDIAADEPERAEQMSKRLERFVEAMPTPDAGEPDEGVDEETRRALRSLGYLE